MSPAPTLTTDDVNEQGMTQSCAQSSCDTFKPTALACASSSIAPKAMADAVDPLPHPGQESLPRPTALLRLPLLHSAEGHQKRNSHSGPSRRSCPVPSHHFHRVAVREARVDLRTPIEPVSHPSSVPPRRLSSKRGNDLQHCNVRFELQKRKAPEMSCGTKTETLWFQCTNKWTSL